MIKMMMMMTMHGDYMDFSMLWRAVAVSWHSGASTEWARAYRLDYDEEDDDDDDDDDDEGGDDDGDVDFHILKTSTWWNLK